MVIDMGCHLMMDTCYQHSDGGTPDINIDIEREMRKRIYWGAFVTDATQSMYLGRQMTLRPREARVPQLLLDTYEELEEWSPYIDELQPSASTSLLQSYLPQPAHAVSTFTALMKLAGMSAQITETFYSIDSIRRDSETLRETKANLEKALQRWKSKLPPHLMFDPEVDPVPPPHQITPQ